MQALLQLIIETVLHPRETAMGMTAERYDRTSLWTGAFLVIVLSGMLQYGLVSVMPEDDMLSLMFPTPFMTTLMMGCGLIVMIFAVYFGGQMMGGKGHFPETLVLMVWLQVLQVAIAVVKLVLLSMSADLVGVAALFNLVAGAAVFYATLHFVDVLHGFNSLWAAFGTLVISVLGLAVGLALILAIIGGAAVQTGAI